MSSSNKRYYWLKLKEDFFEDDTIQWLEEQDNGKDYVIFYLKLALRSLDDNGRLVRYVGETLIPYDVKALAKLTSTSADTVAVAMKVFLEIGLISRLEGGEIYMNQINEMIGSETDVARRVRKHRARKAIEDKGSKDLLQSNTDETKCNTDIEIDIEIEKDIDKDTTTTEKKEEKPKKSGSGDKLPSKNVFGAFEKLWMFPNFVQKEMLIELSERYSDELIVAAIKVAGANDVIKGRAINFIEAVLKEWENNNVKDIEQAREYTRNRNKQNKRNNYNNQPSKKESLPDWATEENKTQEETVDVETEKDMKERLKKIRAMRVGENS